MPYGIKMRNLATWSYGSIPTRDQPAEVRIAGRLHTLNAELYIPIDQSPGVSGIQTIIGTIESVNTPDRSDVSHLSCRDLSETIPICTIGAVNAKQAIPSAHRQSVGESHDEPSC
jgi:hypothetical protein